jgi:hypothetical protein
LVVRDGGPWRWNKSQGPCSLKGARRSLCGISWASLGRGKASFKFQCSLDSFIACIWTRLSFREKQASKQGVLGNVPARRGLEASISCVLLRRVGRNKRPPIALCKHGDMDAGNWAGNWSRAVAWPRRRDETRRTGQLSTRRQASMFQPAIPQSPDTSESMRPPCDTHHRSLGSS